jgi:putative transposase
VLKEAELGMLVADITRQVGIAEETSCRWRKQHAGIEPDHLRELKQLQDENTRLKKLVAELSLDKAALQDIHAKRSPGPR